MCLFQLEVTMKWYSAMLLPDQTYEEAKNDKNLKNHQQQTIDQIIRDKSFNFENEFISKVFLY